MRTTIRRGTISFLTGFVVTFLIYLFVRFNADQVMLGMVIGTVGGVTTAVAVIYLFRKLAEEDAATTPPR